MIRALSHLALALTCAALGAIVAVAWERRTMLNVLLSPGGCGGGPSRVWDGAWRNIDGDGYSVGGAYG